MGFHCLYLCVTVSPSAQLLEQTARLQSLSDALDKLKVRTATDTLVTDKYNANTRWVADAHTRWERYHIKERDLACILKNLSDCVYAWRHTQWNIPPVYLLLMNLSLPFSLSLSVPSLLAKGWGSRACCISAARSSRALWLCHLPIVSFRQGE